MGIDLTLVMTWPFVNPARNLSSDFFPANKIDLDRDSELWDCIRKLPSNQLPMEMRWFEDDGLKSRTDDRYDTPLRYVRAADIAARIGPRGEDRPWSRWNAAVMEFLGRIDPETWVVLFWH